MRSNNESILGFERPFILAIETSLRQNDLIQLRWDWIDSERRVIEIPDEYRATKGKKGMPAAIPFWNSTAQLLASLTRVKLEDGTEDPRVLPIGRYVLSAQWKKIQKMGFADLTWHDLRHEAASRFSAAGMNSEEARSLTGHKTTQMLSRYTHHRALEIQEKFAAHFDGPKDASGPKPHPTAVPSTSQVETG